MIIKYIFFDYKLDIKARQRFKNKREPYKTNKTNFMKFFSIANFN